MWSWLQFDSLKHHQVFYNYGHRFAYLRHVIIDSQNAFEKHGGEPVEDVLDQERKSELLDLPSGFFSLACEDMPVSHFSGSYLDTWMNVTVSETRTKNKTEVDDVVSGYTLALQRYKYTSLLNTMATVYNAFLTTLVLNVTPPINILIMDGHPYNVMNELWSNVFGKVVRAGHLSGKIKFENMIWNIPEEKSLMLQPAKGSMPFADEFRQFIFSAYGVSSERNVMCGKLSLLFVWRRDYITHARNSKGNVSRKIVNEKELLSAVQKTFPSFDVSGYQMDTFSMKTQLKLVAQTDVLMGMAGSGLTHALFLPQNGAVVEVKSGSLNPTISQFEAMARWRDLKYGSVSIEAQEQDHYVYVPPKDMIDVVKRVVSNMC
ncbi:uncharacterized protein LOC121367301 [Gigantopelta aegis]|uniref:uncharacterized protein LOC121367301 n=1 Tax=Gigantopelta aegis TaxID=1735272 RepID=UPI001B889E5D|nr:uncharacterized protein LOC121367301 [Gigantopelta aegis]